MHLLTVLGATALVCLLVQRFFKPYLERDQYYYLKDITLIGAWALCGIWSQSPLLRATITAGIAAGLLGFCQRVQKRWDLRPGFWLIGLGLALAGPRITFFGLPHGAFHYLSEVPSLLVSAFWVGLLPCVLQEIDQIPGLGGALLAAGWTLMLLVTLLASGGWNDAVFASLAGFVLLLVFWSRHVHVYRRLGEPLAALWGTLMAGTAILGVTKGLTFSTLLVLPLGLFALPLLETSIHLLSTAFALRRTGNLILYRSLINRGVDHPTAVHTVTALCALLGLFAVSGQMGPSRVPLFLAGLLVLCLGSLLLWNFLRREKTPRRTRRPRLWGTVVDNVSLHYALGKVRSWVGGTEPRRIFTVDALAALRSRSDREYREAVGAADLVLPDGKGLIWAFAFLGTPIQERLPGVEFVEHLCRQAAGEGWPVYFLGGRPGIAERAASELQRRFPGLQVAGCRNGYFGAQEEPEVLQTLQDSGARILFLGLGVPRQEFWLHRCARSREGTALLPGVVGMGIGGSMDVLSGELQRAPKIWQRWGLEWLYRTLQEPWRWKRVMRLPLFVALVLWTRLAGDRWIVERDDPERDAGGGWGP